MSDMGGMGSIVLNSAQKSQLGLQSGISAGAAAGIGAGVGVPLAIIAGVLGILLLRQRKKTKTANLFTAYSVSGATSPKPNHSTSTSTAPWRGSHLADGRGQLTAELPLESTIRHELPQ